MADSDITPSRESGSGLSLGQSVLAHGGVYTISQIANQGMAFLLLPVYAHLIGDYGFGVLSILSVMATVMTLLMAQGMPGAWFRLRFDKKTPESLRIFESTILWYLVLTAPILVLALCLWGEGFARLVAPGIPFYPLIFVALLSALAGIFPVLYERKLQAERKPVQYAVFSGARTLATLLLIILFVVGFRRGVQGKVEADLISFGFFAVLMFFLVGILPPNRFSKTDLKSSLAYGLPLVPHSLAGWTNNMIDRFIVNLMLGLSATGVYSMGYQIASLAMILGVSLNQAYTPLAYQSFKRVEELNAAGDEPEAGRLLREIARTGLLLVSTIVCFSFFLTSVVREVLIVMTTVEFKDSWSVVGPVTAGMIALGCYFVFVPVVSYSPKLVRFMPLITAGASIVNISVNLALIPHLGIFGSALATLTSNAALAVLALRISRKSPIRVPFDWWKLAALIATGLVGLSVLWMLDRFLDAWVVRLPLKLAGFVLLTLAATRTAGFTPAEILDFGRRLLAKGRPATPPKENQA